MSDKRAQQRADEINPEEKAAGITDGTALAAEVLAESDEREEGLDEVVEHRRSDETSGTP